MIVGMRHARVANPDWVVYARLPGFHLSEEGRAEVEGVSAALGRAPLEAVYASPLERAVETAAVLARPHGLPVRTDQRLIEWGFWMRWQGMPWSRIREREPDLLELYARDPGAVSPDDGLEDAGARVLGWAEEAEHRHGPGLVVGVSHEAPLAAALLVSGGRDLAAFHGVNLPHLGAVRLRPGPAEMVDLVQWAMAC